MSEITRQRLTPKQTVRPYQGRGPIYAWLRAHHAVIEALRPGTPCLWAELALDMAEDGIQTGAGSTPDRNCVRLTWPRVCRDVAAAAAAEATRQAKPPSRLAPASPAPPGPALPARRSQGALIPSGPGPRETATGMDDFPTTDPSGAPLPDGYVLYNGRSLPRHAAVQLASMERQGHEMDEGK